MMACLYNNDLEVYEKYILNQLPDNEKTKFEAHLSSCKICQNRLEKEKWLQANLREIGKREMKSEIRKQVNLKRAEKKLTDWGMVMRVAAIILFVVLTPGIIYYYQYLAPPTVEHEVQQDKIVESEETITPQAGLYQDEDRADLQVMPEKPPLAELKKIEQIGEREASARTKEGEIAQSKEIPAEDARQVGDEKLEKSRPLKDATYSENLSAVATETEEIEKFAGKVEPAAAMADDGAVFRYESDQSAVKGKNENLDFFQSRSVSESQVNQKTWLFRKSSQEITIQLQLVDENRDEDKEFPKKIPAQVTLQDSFRMMIECQVTPELYKLDPDSITLYQPNSQILQIQLPRQVIYQIDLTQKSQEAIQIRP
jgi:hypothetical protein